MSDRKIIRVKSVMKKEFDMVDGLMTVSETLRKMKHVDTKSLIVNKRHDDDAYGMVLLSDIAKQVLAKDKAPDRVNVYEIMSKPVITVEQDMDIRYCARLFEKFGLSRAPVVSGGEIVGIVSLTDMVLKGLCADLD
ncbi:MAG: CBS domain-containing protein [Gammaproteobacteria bacterium]|nr:CBS domain-containing protein [Gammaproteobacteria bacterium]